MILFLLTLVIKNDEGKIVGQNLLFSFFSIFSYYLLTIKRDNLLPNVVPVDFRNNIKSKN